MEGKFHYVDGEMAHFFEWDANEPNNIASEKCVAFEESTLLYRTRRCNSLLYFMCERELEGNYAGL